MSIYRRRLTVSLPWAIFIFTLVLIGVFVYLTVRTTKKGFFEDEGPFFVFTAGLVPGLAVAIMQFLLSWAEFSEISRLKAMDIKNVLRSRDEEEFYREFIKGANRNIEVHGVTAWRLMRDFADENSTRDAKKALVTALSRGVHVRILVAEQGQLSAEDSEDKFPQAARRFQQLSNRFDTFEIRYFNHQPNSSIVRVDDDVLVGPIFANVESRNTPAIQTSVNSDLGRSYMSHFEFEWIHARPLGQP